MNKKVQQILAIAGVVLLVGLYILTLIFALMDNEYSTYLFKASIYATITIPVLLYGYLLIYKVLKNRK